jgi:hypothetical protein
MKPRQKCITSLSPSKFNLVIKQRACKHDLCNVIWCRQLKTIAAMSIDVSFPV